MKDAQTDLEEVPTNAAEVAVLAGATSGHASEIENAAAPAAPDVASAESQTVEFWNWVPAADREQAMADEDAANKNEEDAADSELVPLAVRVSDHQRAGQLYRRLPWLSLVILVAIAGAFAIASNGTEEDWFSGPVVESKPRPAAEPSEEPKPGVAAPEVSKDQSAELLPEQVAVLPAPLGHPERAVAERANNFENAPAEIVEPRTRRDVARPPRHRKLAVSVQRRRPQSGWLLVGTGQGWRVMWRQAGHQLPFSSVP